MLEQAIPIPPLRITKKQLITKARKHENYDDCCGLGGEIRGL
jgi:hypothetical protein